MGDALWRDRSLDHGRCQHPYFQRSIGSDKGSLLGLKSIVRRSHSLSSAAVPALAAALYDRYLTQELARIGSKPARGRLGLQSGFQKALDQQDRVFALLLQAVTFEIPSFDQPTR